MYTTYNERYPTLVQYSRKQHMLCICCELHVAVRFDFKERDISFRLVVLTVLVPSPGIDLAANEKGCVALLASAAATGDFRSREIRLSFWSQFGF